MFQYTGVFMLFAMIEPILKDIFFVLASYYVFLKIKEILDSKKFK